LEAGFCVAGNRVNNFGGVCSGHDYCVRPVVHPVFETKYACLDRRTLCGEEPFRSDVKCFRFFIHSTFFKVSRRFRFNCCKVFGRPFVKRFALLYRTVVCLCLSCLVLFVMSVTLVYCVQTVEWIKTKLGTEVGLDPGHIVLDGDPAFPTGHSPPIFGPCLLWPTALFDGSRCHLV